jgi:protein phosphatase PTC2/3
VRDQEFPQNPKQAIINAYYKADQYFLDTVERFSNGRVNMLDRSGSCAIVTLVVDDLCYTINVGDSRAIMSVAGGKHIASLSYDHKPGHPSEQQRIN